MHERAVYKWYKCFLGSHESTEYDVRVGRPSTMTNEKVEEIKRKVIANHHTT